MVVSMAGPGRKAHKAASGDVLGVPGRRALLTRLALFFTALFAILIFLACLRPLREEYGGMALLGVPAAFLVLSALFWLLSRLRLPEGAWLAAAVAVAAAARLAFALAVQTEPESDFFMMYDAASYLARGDAASLQVVYFAHWPYMVPFVCYEALVLRLLGGGILALKLFNVAWMTGSALMIYRIARRLGAGIFPAFFLTLLYALYPEPVLLSSVLTNQHIALFFILLGVWLLCGGLDLRHTVPAGLSLCVGNLMRPDGVLVLAAFAAGAAVVAIRDRPPPGKTILALLGLFLAWFILRFAAGAALGAAGLAPQGIANLYPEWKFVVGLDTASGGLFTENYAYLLDIPDKAARRAEALRIIRASLTECDGVFSFFVEKVRKMWGSLAPGYWALSGLDMSREFRPGLTFGELTRTVILLDKYLYMSVFALVPGACAKSWKRGDASLGALTLCLLLCAGFAVYLLIEIQIRYRYFFMPFVFILAALALGEGSAAPAKRIKTQGD